MFNQNIISNKFDLNLSTTLSSYRASPDISQKVITSHTLKLRDSYPEACNALIDDIYMDDTIVSHPN
jgi:hypothetical protein